MLNGRVATWANIGTDVHTSSKIGDVLQSAKLDYNVRKSNIFLPDGKMIHGKFATVNESTGDAMGIVGSDYTVCQNLDAFDFVNYIDQDIEFVKAGQTKSGLVYVIGKLPERYILGDGMEPYVIFQNGHNGFISIRAAIVPLRIICQNQFAMAFRNAQNGINIRHFSTLDMQMRNGKNVLKAAANYMDTFALEAEKLYAVKLPGKEEWVVENLYPVDDEMSEIQEQRMMEKRADFFTAYHSNDNSNFSGTAWGMVNAYADVLTHGEPGRETKNWQENRFTKTLKNNDMNALLKLIAA